MWTVLYWTRSSRTQFGVSINVWRLAGGTLNITCNFLYCNHQVHRKFWSLCISLNTSDTTDLPVVQVQTDTCSLLRSTRLIGNSVKESCLKEKCSVNMFRSESDYQCSTFNQNVVTADQHLRSVGVETARWKGDPLQCSTFGDRR
jgi:hypothetical protein